MDCVNEIRSHALAPGSIGKKSFSTVLIDRGKSDPIHSNLAIHCQSPGSLRLRLVMTVFLLQEAS